MIFVAGHAAVPLPVSVSLRLERMELTDVEAAMVVAWCRDRAALVAVRKLWLFDNRLGDAGAAALADLMTADMLEVTGIVVQGKMYIMLTSGTAAHVLWSFEHPGVPHSDAASWYPSL